MCLNIEAGEYELGDLNEPVNYKAALLDLESDKWLNSMNVEMQSMKDNKVLDLVDLPSNGKTVGSKWLLKKKTDMDGSIHTYKAHLVANGFIQTLMIDYEETFSPVADIRAIRFLIAITVFYDYEIWKMNVKTAFLNGYLSKEVYMEQPEGFVNPKFPNQDVKSYLGRCFAMKDLGEAAYILEIKIYRDRSKQLIGVVDWKSTKQIIFATSSPEAEYIAASDASTEAAWVRKFIAGLRVVPRVEEPIKMYCKNTGTITIANESRITKGGRHYRAKVYYLREVIEYGDVKLEKFYTDDNLADPFIKALAFPKYSEHTKNIGMLPASKLM
nr:putative retrotransposon Ty1-copia subclass protein [Tanacetum cinerariifolium]GEY56143.1 putative retrotransposon Ty1-copia subclass protein [Tanacetum cinerariifolium]